MYFNIMHFDILFIIAIFNMLNQLIQQSCSTSLNKLKQINLINKKEVY